MHCTYGFLSFLPRKKVVGFKTFDILTTNEVVPMQTLRDSFVTHLRKKNQHLC